MIKPLDPYAKPSNDTTMFYGLFNHVNDLIFEEPNFDSVRKCAIRTKGSQGPLGLDANFLSKILCNSTFCTASDDICYAVTLLPWMLY